MCEIACLTQSLCVFLEYIFLYYKHNLWKRNLPAKKLKIYMRKTKTQLDGE